jgi:hypothetical protein
VDLDIEGEHLIPVVWNQRLYLFWPIFAEGTREDWSETAEDVEPTKIWKIQMAWSEYKNRRWSAKKVSSQGLELPKPLPPGSDPQYLGMKLEKEFYQFRALNTSKDLGISVFQRTEADEYFEDFPNDVNSRFIFKIAEFSFKGCDMTLQLLKGAEFQHEGDTHPGANMFSFMGMRPYSDDERLFVSIFWREISDYIGTDNSYVLDSMVTLTPVLNKCPSGSRFNLLIQHQDRQFDAGKQSFFFQDDIRTFFVSPQDLDQGIPLKQADSVHIGLANEITKNYYNAEVIGGGI